MKNIDIPGHQWCTCPIQEEKCIFIDNSKLNYEYPFNRTFDEIEIVELQYSFTTNLFIQEITHYL